MRKRETIKSVLQVAVIAAISFVGASVAFAQDPETIAQLSKPVLDAIMSGNYAAAAALGLVLAVALTRRYGGSRWPVLASATVAPFLVMLGSFGASLGTTLLADADLSGAMVIAALKVALYASGSYAMLKPIIAKLRKIAPPWMSPLFAIVDSIFDAKAKAVEKATEAGRIAVEKNPGKGAGVDFKDF